MHMYKCTMKVKYRPRGLYLRYFRVPNESEKEKIPSYFMRNDRLFIYFEHCSDNFADFAYDSFCDNNECANDNYGECESSCVKGQGKLLKLLEGASEKFIVGLFNIIHNKTSIKKKYLRRACMYLERERVNPLGRMSLLEKRR